MIAAPTQQDRAAWKDTRIGRFTASRFGALMTQPRSKAAREAGAFGAEGTGYIFAKAIERLTGVPMDDAGSTPVMRRGLLLEPAALHILSTAWKPCEACTWQAYGDNLGSTPDALVEAGHATMDLKCPGNPADVVRFADEVVDGDFDTLLAWDSTYAWQVMVQALTCGCDTAHLVYFTDRLAIHRLTDEQLQEAQTLIDLRAEQYEKLSQRLGEALGQRLASQIARGVWKVELALKPQDLGNIEIKLDMKDGALEASFKATEALTRDLISDGLPKLKEALAQSGMEVAQLNVNVRQDSQNGGNPTPGRNKTSAGINGVSKGSLANASLPSDSVATGKPKAQGNNGLDVLV